MPPKKKRNTESVTPLPSRDKRLPRGTLRFVRLIGHHFVLLGACRCARSYDTGPSGVCGACGGAVLTIAERAA